jgi:uncharacterized membrane protein YedE/YeeE
MCGLMVGMSAGRASGRRSVVDARKASTMTLRELSRRVKALRPVDVAQWAFLAFIAAGFWLISVRAGLIASGVLGLVGSTFQELAGSARDRPAMSEAQAAEEARTNRLGFRQIRRDRSG